MDAKERLQEHIDGLFEDAPRSRAAYDLREELLSNSIERYEDMLKDGMGEEPAYQSVIDSIGDVDELIAALPKEDREASDMLRQENRERSALLMTVSVGLYILAGIVFLLSVVLEEYLGIESLTLIGLIVAAVICIVPTCMLVYNAYAHPKYKKTEDTVVESFKEWNDDSKKGRQLFKAISGFLWTLCVLIYLVVSFTTGAWAYTWMIFVAAVCVEGAVNLFFKLREMR